jgi:hypothetical protein
MALEVLCRINSDIEIHGDAILDQTSNCQVGCRINGLPYLVESYEYGGLKDPEIQDVGLFSSEEGILDLTVNWRSCILVGDMSRYQLHSCEKKHAIRLDRS